MKITIEHPKAGEEDEVIIRCGYVDERLMEFIRFLKAGQTMVTGYMDDKIMRLSPRDIFYFESVDNRVFAYTGKEVYTVHKKLYEIEEEFFYTDFLRISKSVIVNVAKIAYLRPVFNGRFEAKLKNGEKVVISRQYVADLKKKIGI